MSIALCKWAIALIADDLLHYAKDQLHYAKDQLHLVANSAIGQLHQMTYCTTCKRSIAQPIALRKADAQLHLLQIKFAIGDWQIVIFYYK